MNRLAMMIGVVALALMPCGAFAGAFAQHGFSGEGVGVANAFVATADTPSAMAYNPSGIAWQPGFTLEAGGAYRYRNSTASSSTATTSTIGEEDSTGHLYSTWMPRGSNWGVGMGLYQPYQQRNNWSAALGGSESALNIQVNRLSVDVVHALSSSLAVSAGVDSYFSRLAIRRGASSFAGRDWSAVGGHISASWRPVYGWSFGTMLRMGARLKHVDGLQKTDLQLPDEVSVAIAHNIYDGLKLEGDVNWTRWSRLTSMNITGGAAPLTLPLSLKDTLDFRLGLTWTWRPNTQLRFGYAYEQGAGKDTGFDALIADQSGHRFSIGAGGNVLGTHADLAYTYVYYPHSTVPTGNYAAVYSGHTQALMLSLTSRW